MKQALTLALSMIILVAMAALLQPGMQVGEANNDAPTAEDPKNSITQIGPEWLDTDWHYRRPIVITNDSGETLTDYQVLIELNDSNFDFSKANTDGSDMRFTAGDGITEISYWIESWGSQLAYIWVEIPNIDAGNNIIYMYYFNTETSTTSSGTETFNLLFDDDWEEFIEEGCPNTTWICPDYTPEVISNTLVLSDTTGIITTNSYLYKVVGYRANYVVNNGYEWGGFINGTTGSQTVIRDKPSDVHNLFLLNRNSGSTDEIRLVPVGVSDWHDEYHTFEIRWQEGISIADIDHGVSVSETSLADAVPNSQLPITFYNFNYLSSNTVLKVDWVYVRDYVNPEPEVTFGTEQGLVDLQIAMSDEPDPVYAGESITYHLTITNTSDIDAPGVVVTDALPAEVDFISATPSQGACDDQVICNLDAIEGGESASILVVAATTADGVITNTAEVGSLAYDSDLLTNIAVAPTTVFASADLAVALQGDPEVLKPGDSITYYVSITNHGPSRATGLSVGITLPDNVYYQSADPNICNDSNGIVTCSISSLNSSTSEQLLISAKVQTTTSTNLLTTASISSATHDPNPANDVCVEETYVDAELPEVYWVSPVSDEQTYFTGEDTITLIAAATDNYMIDQVVFTMWDHLWNNGQGHYVPIGTATIEPYQVMADISELKAGELYQMYVEAYDLAGNKSSRQRIFIVRTNLTFMPLISGK